MQTSIEHMPAGKQAQLAALVELIRSSAPVEMLILFGSHARGDWVDDPMDRSVGAPVAERRDGQTSNFDILVVVDRPSLVGKHELWSAIQSQSRQIAGRDGLHLIVHDIRNINHKLEHGWFFFTDVVRGGIKLHDSGRHTLAAPALKSVEERRAYARQGFDKYFRAADRSYRFFEISVQEPEAEMLKIAAFQLHQATENYYKAALLVFAAYVPEHHSIAALGLQCSRHHPAFHGIFSRTTSASIERFELLETAYEDARYSRTYSITRADLDILAGHVRILRERTERACRARIEAMAPA